LNRTVRYEGAILRDHYLLQIKIHVYASGRDIWMLPGGGIEPGETEEDCVRREVREETRLDVVVDKLLLDEPELPGLSTYQKRRVFRCKPLSGDAKPGYEPEIEAQRQYGIVGVGWFDLRDDQSWDPVAVNNPATYAKLQSVRKALGYIT
jgi:8-oxo-dGTP pyrophosphatase MutT (NUDIX family)